jgi:hypothetical protein
MPSGLPCGKRHATDDLARPWADKFYLSALPPGSIGETRDHCLGRAEKISAARRLQREKMLHMIGPGDVLLAGSMRCASRTGKLARQPVQREGSGPGETAAGSPR